MSAAGGAMSAGRRELRALLFDVDGTFEEVHRRAFNAAFSAAGLSWHWSPEQYVRLLRVGGGKERIRSYVAQNHPHLLQSPWAKAFIAELHRKKTRHYTLSVAAGCVHLRPGVARLIDQAVAGGLKTAVVTTAHRAGVRALLEAAFGPRADYLFDSICCGEDVVDKKPAPDAYLWTLRALGLPPTACIAIEDSGIGVLAARRAGIAVLTTPSRYTANDDFHGSLAVLSDLGQADKPFRVLSGPDLAPGVVDLALLVRLLGQDEPPA